jgi:hypothetical protein
VEKPTQALKSVKGPGNTFDLNSKWSRTLPSLIYFSWNIYRDPPPLKKNQISKLIFEISTLIFEKNFMEGVLYKYPMKNILRTAKFLPTWGVIPRFFPGL